MGVQDARQWLPAAFARSAAAVGATAGREELEEHARGLVDRWSGEERHHHGLKHLVKVLTVVDEIAQETHHPDLVRLAAWYHGVVFSVDERQAYRRAAGEDEAASADLAEVELAGLGVPADAVARVGELIRRLRGHDCDTRDIDQLALVDAHLAILAKSPQDYRAYRETVRREYSHLPPRHYLQARIAIVDRLLARRRIFGSPMCVNWEEPARENLTSELAILTEELAELGPGGPEGDISTAEHEAAAEPEVIGGTRGVLPEDDGAGSGDSAAGAVGADDGTTDDPEGRRPVADGSVTDGSRAQSRTTSTSGPASPHDGASRRFPVLPGGGPEPERWLAAGEPDPLRRPPHRDARPGDERDRSPERPSIADRIRSGPAGRAPSPSEYSTGTSTLESIPDLLRGPLGAAVGPGRKGGPGRPSGPGETTAPTPPEAPFPSGRGRSGGPGGAGGPALPTGRRSESATSGRTPSAPSPEDNEERSGMERDPDDVFRPRRRR
jgi:predicted metal-dependent HD superfamily phosphohydrolase